VLRLGGIEVIAGKSQLTISNNSIRYNKASGIAIQFYRENSDLGELKIKGNTLEYKNKFGLVSWLKKLFGKSL